MSSSCTNVLSEVFIRMIRIKNNFITAQKDHCALSFQHCNEPEYHCIMNLLTSVGVEQRVLYFHGLVFPVVTGQWYLTVINTVVIDL